MKQVFNEFPLVPIILGLKLLGWEKQKWKNPPHLLRVQELVLLRQLTLSPEELIFHEEIKR